MGFHPEDFLRKLRRAFRRLANVLLLLLSLVAFVVDGSSLLSLQIGSTHINHRLSNILFPVFVHVSLPASFFAGCSGIAATTPQQQQQQQHVPKYIGRLCLVHGL